MIRGIAISTLVVAIFFGAGVFVGTKIKKTSAPAKIENTYQAGWESAMKELQESGALMQLPEAMEIKNINGTIESISGNAITIKVTTPNLMGSPELLTRIVTVDSNTKIVQLVQKDSAQIQKEMGDFNEKMKKQQDESAGNPADMPTPPQTQDRKETSLNDIKVGQKIVVQATEDIKDKKEFIATEIQIQSVLSISENLSQMPSPTMSAPPMLAPTTIAPGSTAPAQKLPATPPAIK